MLRSHSQQSRAWRTHSRFVSIAAGRGSGKTELARRRTVRWLPVAKDHADPPLYFYALPTRQQAKRVAWEPIRALIPDAWIKQAYASDMRIVTVWGSELHVVGMDKPQRIEGNQWDGGVVDESSDQRPGGFTRSIVPALSHRDAWCWRIGVPKRYGCGAIEFKSFFDLGLSGAADTESFSWPSSDILSPAKLAWARQNLDQADFDEQYGASWQTVGGQVFYAFDEKLNVRPCPYNPHLPLIVGSDFNVNPMCWTLSQIHGDELHTVGEVFLRNANTQATLQHLAAKYSSQHKSEWWFCGDAAAQQRHTSASETDYLQIRQFAVFRPLRVFYPKSNPRIVDRFACTNAMLCNAAGRRRWFIDPRATHLIADLKARAYKEGTRAPDDEGDIGHMTDAAGYVIFKFFPIRLATPGAGRVMVA